MSNVTISESIKYIGADDTTLDLFESQYIIPNGISYNSYVILDEKVAVMDTIDARKSEEWFNNLSNVLAGRNVDYIVISHLEPDHAANIKALSDKYPDAKLVLSAKAKAMLPQFFAMDNLDDKCIIAAEGQELSLGTHNLKFIMAPMVHWPEVMLEYETTEKVLFSADAFGKFGALSASEDWTCEARRYYFNIVGNMVHLYRLYSRKPPHLISGLYALCMALYLKRTLNSTLENILHGAVTNLKMMEYL